MGSFGVDVFFVLSGFLITSLSLKDRSKPHFFYNFYTRRIFRIQPIYLLHLLVAWFLLPGSHMYVFLALIFIVNFDEYFHAQDVGPAWTLAIEEQFYLIWPQVIRRCSLKNIYRISIGVMLFSAGLRMGMISILHHASQRSTWYRFDGLAIGALLACQWMGADEGVSRSTGLFLKFFNSRVMLIAGVIWFAGWTVGYFTGITVNLGMAMFSVNYLVYRAIRFIMQHPGSKPFGWLGSRPLTYLGLLSYSMYMFHAFFLYIYDVYIAPPSLALPQFFLRAAFVTACTAVICVLIRILVEKPLVPVRDRFLKREPRSAA